LVVLVPTRSQNWASNSAGSKLTRFSINLDTKSDIEQEQAAY